MTNYDECKNELDLKKVCYSELASGEKGIAIGLNDLFLNIEMAEKCQIQLKRLDTSEDLTAWTTINSIEDLRHSPKTKMIRRHIEERWKNSGDIIEKILIRIQKHEMKRMEEKKGGASEDVGQDFDENIRNEAWNLLREPAFFYKLGKVFEYGFEVPKIAKPRFVLKEERSKRLLPALIIGATRLALTSLILVLGGIGTAKDSLVRLTLCLLPIKAIERGYFTSASLRYSDIIKKSDLLYIPDSPALKGEMGRHLRFMRSDDGGLTVEYALKDRETGEMTTKVQSLPSKAIVSTTNVIEGDSALKSGAWNLETDSSPELTKEVQVEKLKLRAGKRPVFPGEMLKIWKCAFDLLLKADLPEKITIPFAEDLTPLLESQFSSSRRSPDKLCDLIETIAFIRRFQKSEGVRNSADIADLYCALQLGFEAIIETIAELGKREQKIYQAVRQHQTATIRQVADETKCAYATCYQTLETLVERGTLNKDKEKNKNIYSVLRETSEGKLSELLSETQVTSKKLVTFILSSIKNFSNFLGDQNRCYFVDPITGEQIIINRQGNVGIYSGNAEWLNYPFAEKTAKAQKKYDPYTQEELRDSERIMDYASEERNEKEELSEKKSKRFPLTSPKQDDSEIHIEFIDDEQCKPEGD